MSQKQISTKSKRVGQLLKCVSEGRFAIPKLQREFVWDGPKAAKLFDSIFAHMPIGVVMIWETPRSQRLYLRQKYHVLPQFIDKNRNVWFLIDGQQRVSVLHQVREGSELENARGKIIDFKRVVFSLEDEENGQQIIYRKPVPEVYVSLTDILHPHCRILPRNSTGFWVVERAAARHTQPRSAAIRNRFGQLAPQAAPVA